MIATGAAGFVGGRKSRARQRRSHWNAVRNVILELGVIQELIDRNLRYGTPVKGPFEAWNTHRKELVDRAKSLPDGVEGIIAAVYARVPLLENATDTEMTDYRDLVLEARGTLSGYWFSDESNRNSPLQVYQREATRIAVVPVRKALPAPGTEEAPEGSEAPGGPRC